MNRIESEHYVFHYNENSKAEQDIEQIMKYQESCFEHICDVLKVVPDFKLEYYLCNSTEEVGRFCGELCGDYEPCNGFADTPNKIYAVYNDEIFYSEDCAITYPIMGAFTEWLIETYEIEKYLQFYKSNDVKCGIVEEYGMELDELEDSFINYINLMSIDMAVIENGVKREGDNYGKVL